MADLVSRPAHTSRGTFGYTYQKEALRYVAMPLGGIGAGQIALGGDGGLRQWQIVNQINHQGFVPDSFLAPIDYALLVMFRAKR
jgi:non-lysosomal glucosylceramidase